MSRDGWMKKKANASDDNGWAERVSSCVLPGSAGRPVRMIDADIKILKMTTLSSYCLFSNFDVNKCVHCRSCVTYNFCLTHRFYSSL